MRCNPHPPTHHAPGAFVALLFALGACTPAHLGLGGDDGPDGFCGDGNVNGDETCDDANSVDGDGCSAECQPEIPPNCGDGILVVEEGEECDDGNMEGGDGCGLGCWIESCGNGFLDVGEACEDNNNASGDGCSADCKSDESCGNGILDTAVDELCDDGNNDDTDGCPATCEPARCGDGFVRRGIESCDDGNGVADDGCTECILDTCGNAVMDPGEECDQGAANGSDNSSCFRTCLVTDVVMTPEFSDNLSSTSGRYTDITDLTLGDMNGDGVPDIVATDRSADLTAVTYGKGDGGLAVSRHLASYVSGGAESVLVDVNGDGKKDIVAASTSDLIAVALATENGDFVFHNTFTTVLDVGGTTPRAIAAAELTGDAFIDIVTANSGVNDVTLLEGDGAGNFVPIARFGVQSGNGGVFPGEIEIGDVTGDGVLDIVTANSNSSDVAVLAGLGGAQFAAPEIYSTVIGAQGTGPAALVLADVTNDAKLDVLTANTQSSDVTVLAQQGGALANPLSFQTFDGDDGLQPSDLAVGDVNKDGVPDIVTANHSNGDVSIILGLGAGVAFGPPTIIKVAVESDGPQPSTIALGDLNADNTLDIVVGTSIRDVRTMIGNGDGTFSAPAATIVDINASTREPVKLHIADVDGDGRTDVLAQTTADAVVIAGDGNGALFPAASVSVAGGRYKEVADVNGDGRLDFVSMRLNTAGYRLSSQAPNGSFAAATVNSTTSAFPTAIALGDFDGNSTIDFVSVLSTQLELQSGSGTGPFSPFSPALINMSSTGRSIAVADLTGDGDLDIAVTLPSLNEVNVLVGDGAGGFTNPVPFSTQVAASGTTPAHVHLADIDGESGIDMLTANESSNDVTLFRATGNGTFADPKIIPAVFGGAAAAVSVVKTGDVNGDGILDLITANTQRSTVSVVIGFGNGNFAAPQTFDVSAPTALGVADLDGDGLADIVAANATGDVTLFLSGGHP